MRVLQIHTPYRLEGGEDKVVREEAALLERRGHEVVRYCVPNPHARIATVGALALAPWNPVAAREVKRLVRNVHPGIAHVHNTWFRLSPSVPHALHEAGIPVTMTLHNYRLFCLNSLLLRDGRVCEDCVGKQPWRGVVHRCYRNSLPISAIAATALAVGRASHTWHEAVDRFIAPSVFAVGKAADGGIPADRIVYKPHGVADPGPRSAAPSESNVVLFVGRLSYEKGVAGLLDGWARAQPAGLHLTIVGEGPLRCGLEGRRVPNVTFLGWRGADEVRDLLLGARTLVFPSQWYEAAPRVVTEALSAGLPIMAEGLGGVGEILADLGSEWREAQPLRSDWASALRRLANGAAVDSAGQRARQLYEARYTLEQSADRLLEVYADTIQAAGRTAAG